MRPVTIAGSPEGLADGLCGTLAVRSETHQASGHPCMVSEWLPSAEELAALARGVPVRLTILGGIHPPVAIDVGEAPADHDADAA